MEDDSLPLSWNTSGAALSKPLCTSTDEQYDCVLSILTGDVMTKGMIRKARSMIAGSLVFVAVHQGDEILALLPGTIIRSDGVVATCASRLSFRTIKELRVTVTVEVLNGKVTYEGTLLSADFSSNIAFIKFMSPRQQKVAPVAKFFGTSAVAVGCTSQGRGLHDTNFNYCQAFTSGMANKNENKQSDARTSGQVIRAIVEGSGSVIGGPLVQPELGVIGVIHYEAGQKIKATPIDEVLKYLECLLEYREPDPKSVACA
ncbi:hypothetical protein Vadar_008488 [Vaccinium darrowii]|uniref:Uncharacterized protein n=1 Tax=Vaccinium darrowii TaxID=229202 RepID=A0ACB7XXM8_9ERIC|nr:hypothetical protein Vadar_008488 [Vaccinium darrowii]